MAPKKKTIPKQRVEVVEDVAAPSVIAVSNKRGNDSPLVETGSPMKKPNYDTAKGGVSLKAIQKKKNKTAKKKAKKDEVRLARDHLNPETGVKYSDQPMNLTSKRPFEVKGKRAKIPELGLNPQEKMKLLLEIGQRVPEEFTEEIPSIPTTDNVEEFVNSHPDLEFKDELKLKVTSIRTGHDILADCEKLREYLSQRTYPLKYKRALHLGKQLYDFDKDWLPFLQPVNHKKDVLLSVLKGNLINKDIYAIGKELNSIQFKSRLTTYVKDLYTKDTKAYAKTQKIIKNLEGKNGKKVEKKKIIEEKKEEKKVVAEKVEDEEVEAKEELVQKKVVQKKVQEKKKPALKQTTKKTQKKNGPVKKVTIQEK